MIDVALLILRITLGALLTGHGAQKLFGAFGGPGLAGTRGMVASLGIRPARLWAPLAGLSEFGGGLLTALGLLSPLGPLGILASMAIAIFRAHWGKPIWVTSGGAELPLTHAVLALAIALTGPGRYSLDAALGIALPAWLAWTAAAGTVVGVAVALAPGMLKPVAANTAERRDRAA